MVSQSNLGRLIIGRLLIYTSILVFSSMKTVSHRGRREQREVVKHLCVLCASVAIDSCETRIWGLLPIPVSVPGDQPRRKNR